MPDGSIKDLIEAKKDSLKSILDNGCGKESDAGNGICGIAGPHCQSCTENGFVLAYELYGYGELL